MAKKENTNKKAVADELSDDTIAPPPAPPTPIDGTGGTALAAWDDTVNITTGKACRVTVTAGTGYSLGDDPTPPAGVTVTKAADGDYNVTASADGSFDVTFNVTKTQDGSKETRVIHFVAAAASGAAQPSGGTGSGSTGSGTGSGGTGSGGTGSGATSGSGSGATSGSGSGSSAPADKRPGHPIHPEPHDHMYDVPNHLFTLKRIVDGTDTYLAGQFIRVEDADYAALKKAGAAIDVCFNPSAIVVDNASAAVALTGKLIEIFPGGRDNNP